MFHNEDTYVTRLLAEFNKLQLRREQAFVRSANNKSRWWCDTLSQQGSNNNCRWHGYHTPDKTCQPRPDCRSSFTALLLVSYSPRSQGPQTLLIFWWTKCVQSSSISVYSERIHTPSLVRRPILRYLQNCTHFTYNVRTDSYVSCREYCKQFEINTTRHLLSAVFIARYFKYRKHKTQPYLQSEDWFLRKL